MANIVALAAELTTDPLARGYVGMTDAEVSASLNTQNRSLVLTNMSGDQIFAQTDTTEFAALTDLKKQLWMAFCARDVIDPFGGANVAFVQFIFGGASATVASLDAARTLENNQSRAEELNLGSVSVGAVTHARSL